MRLEEYKGRVERLVELIEDGVYKIDELLPKLKEISKMYEDELKDENYRY